MADVGVQIQNPVPNNPWTQFTPSYEGVISRYLSQTDFLSKNLSYLVDIQYDGKYAIPTARVTGSNGGVFQTYSVTPNPSNAQGYASFTDRVLDVTNSKVDVFLTFDPLSFVGYWKNFINPDQPFNYKNLPAQVQATIISLLLNQTQAGVDQALLVGNTSLTGSSVSAMLKSFNGFFTKASSDSETYKTSGTTTLTSSNIISELQRAIRQARQNSMYVRQASYDTDFKILMSYNTWQMYSDALRALTYKSITPTDANAKTVVGIEIQPCAYAPDNHFIGAVATNSPKSSLWTGVSTIGDLSNIMVDRLYSYSHQYFMRMTMALDCQFANPETVLYY